MILIYYREEMKQSLKELPRKNSEPSKLRTGQKEKSWLETGEERENSQIKIMQKKLQFLNATSQIIKQQQSNKHLKALHKNKTNNSNCQVSDKISEKKIKLRKQKNIKQVGKTPVNMSLSGYNDVNKFIDLSKGHLGMIQNLDRQQKQKDSIGKNLSGQGRKINKTVVGESQSIVNISVTNIINPRDENQQLVNKIEKMVFSSKRLDEKVLIKLDEIFNQLIDKNTLFRSSIEKLKCFISQILQSVLDKLVNQQDGIEELKNVDKQNKKLKEEQIRLKNQLKENKDLKNQLKESQNELIYFREKETKLIKLLLAVKDTGVDLEKIFQKTIINEESKENKRKRRIQRNGDSPNDSQMNNLTIDYFKNNQPPIQSITPLLNKSISMQADVSILNDSDESSYNFIGKDKVTDLSSDLNIKTKVHNYD